MRRALDPSGGRMDGDKKVGLARSLSLQVSGGQFLASTSLSRKPRVLSPALAFVLSAFSTNPDAKGAFAEPKEQGLGLDEAEFAEAVDELEKGGILIDARQGGDVVAAEGAFSSPLLQHQMVGGPCPCRPCVPP